MKRNLVNFTRGSQLLGHFGFMFAAGLKGPLLIALATLTGLGWWEVSSTLSDHDRYLVWMQVYAELYAFMELDPAKLITIETGLGGTVQLAISHLHSYPPAIEAWGRFVAALWSAATLGTFILIPGFIAFYGFAARFGGKSKERKHERGAMLVTLPELEREIADHNAGERARELSELMGWQWRLARRSELDAAGIYRPASIAGVPFPWRLEQSHAMLIGTTGTGKTVALRDLIGQARAQGQRAVIFDLTGAFIEAFYQSDCDIILNPLDARCPQWSVFDECQDEAEFSATAEALVPHDGGGSEQFWVLAARLLFVEMCLRLKRDGKASNADLARELMTADLSQVHKLMRGTVADPLTAPEAARMAESIRAVFNANAKALKLLPDRGPQFSIKEWVRDAEIPGSMLFISARYVDMSVSSQLLTVWMDIAMNTLMAMERTHDLRLWFILDELGALHRLPALEKGLQTARNFGGAIVTGIHAFAKLKEVYGENMAMTLSSLARTKLMLATADRETATWCSDFIGHRQVRDMEEGYSYGYNNARDAVSLTPRRQIEPLLLPDQLMNLPRLSGYLKFPDGFPAAPVKLVHRHWPKRAEPFIRRADDNGASGLGDTSSRRPNGPKGTAAQKHPDDPPAANDDGAGKPLERRQQAFTFERPAMDSPGEPSAGDPQAARGRDAMVGASLDAAGPGSGAANHGHETKTADTPQAPRAHGSQTGGMGSDAKTDDATEMNGGRSDAPPKGLPGTVMPDRNIRPLGDRRDTGQKTLMEGVAVEREPLDIGEYDIDL